MTRIACLMLVFAMLGAVEVPPTASLILPEVFSDHMVLQRDMPVPIWGTCAAGARVTVSFRDQKKSVTAGTDGKWRVTLDALKAGGPDTLMINTKTITDVLVGEVWIGSGQSNMDMTIKEFAKGDAVLAAMQAEQHPRIRFLRLGRSWRTDSEDLNVAFRWDVNAGSFSALLFAFGVQLQKELDVPIGLIHGAHNGSQSGPWLTEDMLLSNTVVKAEILRAQQASPLPKPPAQTPETNRQNPGVTTVQPLQPGTSLQKIGSLYDRYIKKVVGYGIRGVLWDQGEAGTAIQSVSQHAVMSALMAGWRKDWGQGDFPFIYVQKPSGPGCAWDYTNPVTRLAKPYAPLPDIVPATDTDGNESFIRMMTIPKTAMVISSDLGDGIHPDNKSGYGARAVRVALATVYDRPIEYYGPLYASHRIDGGKIRISYTHVGKGLAFKGGRKLQGFAIAGADKRFVWADAVIDGNAVVVSSAKVSQPTAVRYAWPIAGPWANLFNKDGLPAITFRTDSLGDRDVKQK